MSEDPAKAPSVARSDGSGRRRARRAIAPPTSASAAATPEADWARFARPDGAEETAKPKDERKRWFVEQRPPHWS